MVADKAWLVIGPQPPLQALLTDVPPLTLRAPAPPAAFTFLQHIKVVAAFASAVPFPWTTFLVALHVAASSSACQTSAQMSPREADLLLIVSKRLSPPEVV